MTDGMSADRAALKEALRSGQCDTLKSAWARIRGAPKGFFSETASDAELWPLVAEWARQTRDAVFFLRSQNGVHSTHISHIFHLDERITSDATTHNMSQKESEVEMRQIWRLWWTDEPSLRGRWR